MRTALAILLFAGCSSSSPTPPPPSEAPRRAAPPELPVKPALRPPSAAEKPLAAVGVKVELAGDWGVVSDTAPIRFVIRVSNTSVSPVNEVRPCVRIFDRDGAVLESSGGGEPDQDIVAGDTIVMTDEFSIKHADYTKIGHVEAYVSKYGCSSAKREALSNIIDSTVKTFPGDR